MTDGTPEAAQRIVRELVEATDTTNRKAALAKAARMVGLGCRRVVGLFYGQAARIDAREWIALINARSRARRERIARLKAELAALEAELQEIETCAPACAWQPPPAPSAAPRPSGLRMLLRKSPKRSHAASADLFTATAGG